ncbi:MAG TPA: amidase [Candidatus Eisenbacteria bacterium]|jgi:Asp-tRNA(Asn)/Glu-tRNA(Gln) amidotransferase A subunit family amidase|nr:amidase [Candidatus Eisenbacteria bacterium]
MTELHFLSLAQLSHKIREQEITPQEVAQDYLRRIKKLQPRLKAFAHVDAESAAREAQVAGEAVLGREPLGPLHGLPITVKSCIDVAGWPCAAGSLLRKDYRPSSDAVLAQRLRAAGAVLLGNTTTPEFLMSYETDNRLTGRTSNPWNVEFSAGGSSGGEAAAIASGCSAGGVGSDGGGSIREPAHFCGICGLKPTPGRIPLSGHYPAGNSAFGWLGVVGPMARTVGDLKILFNVLQGPEPGDALTVPVRHIQIKNGGDKLRIGILEDGALGRVTPETQLAVRRAAQLLAYAGFELEPLRLNNLERVLELWWVFFGTVIGELLQGEIRGREELLSPIFCDYLEAASPAGWAPMSMQQFVDKCAARDRERARILEAVREVPILLSPVSAGPAFRHGKGGYRIDGGYRESMRHSQWLNLVGFPGVSVPMGVSEEGMPIGVQVIGRPYEDELLLDVAERLEQARGPWQGPRIAE